MFVGHFAVALAAKRVTPRLSLPLLFAAVQLLDILWPIFILLGIEHARIVPGLMAASPLDLYDIPYSHSLATSLLWSALAAAPLLALKRSREAAVMAICVFSHFILDFVTHRPDLPLAPGSDIRLGLGLWNYRALEIAVEAGLFLVGIWLYWSGTTPVVRGNAAGEAPGPGRVPAKRIKKMGTIGFAVLMALLAIIWLGGALGPPPPDIYVVAWSIVISMPLILAWTYAIDRARQVRG